MEVITIIIILIVVLLISNKNKKTIIKHESKETINSNLNQTKNSITKENNLLKSKKIYTYDLKGIKYNNYKKEGNFIGICNKTNNSYDKYCIGIYIQNKLSGYTPKNNIKLFNTIKNNNICFGNITFDKYHEDYFGRVNIPLNFNPEEENLIIEILKKIEEYNLFYNKEKSIEVYFNLLEIDKFISENSIKLKINESLYYFFHTSIIPSLSKELEKTKDWKNMILLEKYINRINELSETHKNKTLKRIEEAKLKINEKN